jgi:hypothetical protein
MRKRLLWIFLLLVSPLPAFAAEPTYAQQLWFGIKVTLFIMVGIPVGFWVLFWVVGKMMGLKNQPLQPHKVDTHGTDWRKASRVTYQPSSSSSYSGYDSSSYDSDGGYEPPASDFGSSDSNF